MDEEAISAPLAAAGLLFLGMVDKADLLIPPTLASFASSCTSEDGVIGISVPLDCERLVERSNADWFRLASGEGIIGGVGSQMLLAVKPEINSSSWWWAKVALMDGWDVMGDGASSRILGNGRGHPSFVMISVAGDVILRCDVGQSTIEMSVVHEPHEAPTLRRQGEWMATSPRVDDGTRVLVRRWLESSH